jgi:murein DD-endopeptidase MepM/ murein hydrolase activator NlpD
MFQPLRPLVAAAEVPVFGRAGLPNAGDARFSLVVDLGQDLFSRRWWRGAATLAGLVWGVSLLAPGLDPLPAGPVELRRHDGAIQREALGIAPLSAGSDTGLTMSEGPRARLIAAAPERTIRELSLILSPGDDLMSLLRRSGASASDAARAAALARAAGALPAAGTSLALRLGSPVGGVRGIERLHYRARLDLDLTIARGADGGLVAERTAVAVDRSPLRMRGSASGGLYWALRSAGASPQHAADYLQAIGRTIDVGSEVGAGDLFELVVAQARSASGEVVPGPLLFAGLDRSGASDLALVRWPVRGRLQWIDAAGEVRPETSGLLQPVAARMTSGFGMRVHPILRFARMHRGIDFGAPSGAPIVAAADGRIVKAGWAGGYGRQVRIAHGDGLLTSYSHMSRIVAPEGGIVRRGELIGYVGSSGLSTGPHLHYEVWKNGQAVNPAGVTWVSRPLIDDGLMAAVRARAKALRGG